MKTLHLGIITGSSIAAVIAFGINYDSSGRSIATSGIYLVKLANPIPEFPIAVPILLMGFVSMIIFYRMKFRK